MYTSYDTLIPPSACTHALWAKLDAQQSAKYLLVVRGFFLDIHSDGKILQQIRFHDRLTGICALPDSANGRDLLLVSFAEAKAAIMAWDADLGTLLNHSLHHLERPEWMDAYRTDAIPPPIVRADPEGRCAAMRCYQHALALFTRDESDESWSTRVIRLSEIDAARDELESATSSRDTNRLRGGRLLDFAFLPHFREPTMACLLTTAFTDAGRCEGVKDTCAIAIITVSKSLSVIGWLPGLPFDCQSISPIPHQASYTSLLITSANGFLVVDPSTVQIVGSLACNPYVERTTALKFATQINQFRSLSGSAVAFASNAGTSTAYALLAPLHGATSSLYWVKMQRTGKTSTKIAILPVTVETREEVALPLPAVWSGPALWAVDGDRAFFGSSAGDSHLLAFSKTNEDVAANVASTVEDQETAAIYGSDPRRRPTASSSSHAPPQVSLIDSLPCYSATGSSVQLARLSELTLIGASGRDGECKLSLFHSALAFPPSSSFRIRNARALFPLATAADDVSALLLVSTETASMLMQTTKAGMEEVQESAFYLEGPTHLASTTRLANEHFYVQVHAGGLRVIQSGAIGQVFGEHPLDDGIRVSTVLKASIYGNVLAILLANGTLLAYQLDVSPDGILVVNASSPMTNIAAFHYGPGGLLTVNDSGIANFNGLAFALANLPPVLNTNDVTSDSCDVVDVAVTCQNNEPLYLTVLLTSGLLRIYRRGAMSSWYALCLPFETYIPHAHSTRLRITEVQEGLLAIADGKHTRLLVLSGRYPRVHRVAPDIPIGSSSPLVAFPTLTNPRGLVYLTASSDVSILNDFLRADGGERASEFAHPPLCLDWDVPVTRTACVFASSIEAEVEKLTVSDAEKEVEKEDKELVEEVEVDRTKGFITHIQVHGPSGTVAIAVAHPAPFRLPSDEYAPLTDSTSWKPLSISSSSSGGTSSTASSATEWNSAEAVSHRMLLVNPLTWTVVDSASMQSDLVHSEHITCLQECRLVHFKERHSHSAHNDPANVFLVLGTAYCRGEDRPARGRLILYQVVSVVPREGHPESNRRLKLARADAVRGAVMALAGMHGLYLVAAIGSKVIVHARGEDDQIENTAVLNASTDEDALNGIAFVEGHASVQAIAVSRSFFGVVDLVGGAQIGWYAFQEEPVRIFPLGRACNIPGNSVGLGLLLSAPNVSKVASKLVKSSVLEMLFVVAMEEGGVHFYEYAPFHRRSLRGERLVDRGSLKLPGPIVSIRRVERDVLAYLLDGSIWSIRSLQTSAFAPLARLQAAMVNAVPSPGGLHARFSRQPRFLSSLAGSNGPELAPHAIDLAAVHELHRSPLLYTFPDEDSIVGVDGGERLQVLCGVEAQSAIRARIEALPEALKQL